MQVTSRFARNLTFAVCGEIMKKMIRIMLLIWIAIVGRGQAAEPSVVTNDVMGGWTLEKARVAHGEYPEGSASYGWWTTDTKALVFRKNGKLNGPVLSWHENGRRHFQGQCKDGERDGIWRYWDEKGNLVAEGEFRNGKRWNGTFAEFVLGPPNVYSNAVPLPPSLR